MRFDLGPNLTAAREAALAEVDACAAARVTALGGNTLIHAMKRSEAEGVLQGGFGFPILEQEAAATGQTIQEVARSVLERADAWRVALAKIEGHRIATKAAIRAATTHPAIREIVRNHRESPA
jgi:hypothetical protein